MKPLLHKKAESVHVLIEYVELRPAKYGRQKTWQPVERQLFELPRQKEWLDYTKRDYRRRKAEKGEGFARISMQEYEFYHGSVLGLTDNRGSADFPARLRKRRMKLRE